MKKKKNIYDEVVFRNGILYENGRALRKKDYIFYGDCFDGSSIISGVTGQKYKLKFLKAYKN